MRGPVNPSMKSDFGVVVDGNEISADDHDGTYAKALSTTFARRRTDDGKTFFCVSISCIR